MIIKSNTTEGSKTKLFYKDGKPIELAVCEFNTETSEIKHYELYEAADGDLKVKMTDYKHNEETGVMERHPVVLTETIEGAYAEIDGKRV